MATILLNCTLGTHQWYDFRNQMTRRRTGVLRARAPAVVILAALFVFIAANLISWVCFRHIPHINDEIGYLFQAKIFGLGKLYVPSPCARNSFDFTHIINNGRWYSQYPPGFPAILLLGLAVGAPWIINPLLAACSIFIFYRLGKEIYGESEGRVAAVLGAVSIWFLLTSATMLSHTSSMLVFSLFLLFLFRSLKAPTLFNGLAAGLSLGIAFLIRPYDVVAISIPLVLYFGFLTVRELKLRIRNFSGFLAILLIAGACLLIYNQLTNGHPLKMGYIVKYGEAHSVGFGRAGYGAEPHTPDRGAFLVAMNLAAINKYLFGWPLTSLLFLIPFVYPLKEGKKKTIPDLLLLTGFISLAIGMFFYWGSYVLVGARMFFESLPLLLLMTARGILKTPAILARHLPRLGMAAVKRGLAWVLGLATIFAFGFTFPRWLKPLHSKSYNDYFVKDYRGVTERIEKTVNQLPLGESVVIMKFLYSPQREFPDGLWGSGFLFNDPLLRNRVIYAKDLGPGNIDLLRCYPARKAYLFVGTLDKGMFLPLEWREGEVQYGEPIVFASRKSSSIDLVAKPEDIFFGYSAAFRAQLAGFFANHRLFEADVPQLSRLSQQAREAGDSAKAAFFLESALQIENDESVRGRLLGQLAFDYLRTGNAAEARQLLDRLNASVPRVYDVLPQKGF